MEHDPVEGDPEYQSIFAVIDDEVEASLAKKGYSLEKVGMGFCHMFWSAKARLLKEKYGVEWRSPSEMNDGVLFFSIADLDRK